MASLLGPNILAILKLQIGRHTFTEKILSLKETISIRYVTTIQIKSCKKDNFVKVYNCAKSKFK